MKRTVFCFLSLFFTLSLYAVVATPEPISVRQSDGTLLTIRLHGDEHFAYRTTTDGHFVARDGSGTYHYITYMPDGSYAMTSVVAHNPEMRSTTEHAFLSSHTKELVFAKYADTRRRVAQRANLSSTYPRTGSPRSIVILVNYTDVKFRPANTREQFDRLCNESGYSDNRNQGSCRDFYIAQSDSLFQPQFDVYGPYDLEHTQEYYGGNIGSNNSQRANDMIVEACSKAMAAGVDFSQYDCDNDGVVDNIYVFYAGHGEADTGEENAVWPHRSMVSTSIEFAGKRLRDYACSAELRGGGGMTTIGTFCHEFGHVIGLPDYYDTQDQTNETIGSWDIMCSGSYNGPNGYSGATPPSYSAHSRWWLGWRENIVQLSDAGRYTLAPIESMRAGAYMIAEGHHTMNPTSNSEFFLIENRQNTGWDNSDTSIPGTGLLVWHISYNASLWAGNMPNSAGAMNYAVYSAAGNQRTHGSRADTYPGSNMRTEFNPTLKNGTNLYQPVFAIEQIGDDMTFVFKSESSNAFTVFPTELDRFHSGFDPKTSRHTSIDTKQIFISSDSINPDIPIEISSNSSNLLFAIDSTTSGIRWLASGVKVYPNADSTINQRVFIGFRPSDMYCENDPFTSIVMLKQGNNQQILSVTGISPREVRVTTPEAIQPAQITPYSAILRWKAVDDATKYYLTVYQISDGLTTFKQSFETFNDPAEVALAGWKTNFNQLSATYKSDGTKSLYFQNDGEYVQSELYLQPITQLSFWHASYNVPSLDTVGTFMLEAYNGEKWDTIQAAIAMLSSEKATKTYDFDYDKGYVQFRLTFTSRPKGKGAVIDAFTAVCNKQIDYMFSGSELAIESKGEAIGDTISYQLGNLDSDSEYHFQVQATDEGQGGCVTTVTDASDVLIFRTIAGKTGESDLSYGVDSISYSRRERVIYIPQTDGTGSLYFYDAYGHLIASVPVAQGQNSVPFPAGNFQIGQWYLIKYSPTGTMKRKDRRVKIMY